MDCLFCKIGDGDIPSSKVYEDNLCLAFLDLNPQAPVHCLIIPKQHIESANAITPDNSAIVAHIFEVVPKIAQKLELEKGYRIISNVGEHGCQSIKHLHFHILGGKKLPDKMA